jgi:type II secretory pathway predicted ATPase ExeA
LLNFETYEAKLLQIVLAGTLELRDRIMAKRNKALRSRVFAPCLMNVSHGPGRSRLLGPTSFGHRYTRRRNRQFNSETRK